jgi:hypothetical protein
MESGVKLPVSMQLAVQVTTRPHLVENGQRVIMPDFNNEGTCAPLVVSVALEVQTIERMFSYGGPRC